MRGGHDRWQTDGLGGLDVLLLLLLGLGLLGNWSGRGVLVLARGLLLQGVGLDPLGVRHHLLMRVG